jgi:hypothetical protein
MGYVHNPPKQVSLDVIGLAYDPDFALSASSSMLPPSTTSGHLDWPLVHYALVPAGIVGVMAWIGTSMHPTPIVNSYAVSVGLFV